MTRKAFVCGSNGSQQFGLLRYSVSDAAAVATCLQSPRCGFEVISPQQNDSKPDLLDSLERAAYSCVVGDTFLCYFSGHGVLESGELYLIWDGRERDLRLAGLKVNIVLDVLRDCKASNKLLVLDCCHAGAAARYKGAGLPVDEVVKPQNHRLLMASPRIDKVPELDEIGGSLFSRRFCEALSEKFHEAAGNDDCLSVENAKDWIERQIGEYNKRLSPDGQVPYPVLFGEQKGASFFLTQGRPPWTPHLLDWPDGSQMAVLPFRPWPSRNHPILGKTPKAGDCVLCVARDPVTNAQYRRFVEATGHVQPTGQKLISAPTGSDLNFVPDQWEDGFCPWDDPAFNAPDQPVVCVSYQDSVDYCQWVDGQLPHDPEKSRTFMPTPRLWEWAAFGTEHAAQNDHNIWISSSPQRHHRARHPVPITADATRSNARGLSDMIGQVWEWCSGETSMFASGMISVQHPPLLRGGGFADDLEPVHHRPFIAPFLDSSRFPEGGQMRHFDIGFRLAALVFAEDLPDDIRLSLSLYKDASYLLWAACVQQWTQNSAE